MPTSVEKPSMQKSTGTAIISALERDTIARRTAADLAAATAFAALTALCARFQIYLPFTPVPVTGQVFAVLLAGAILGSRLGFISQVEYLVAGAAGLPVFTHGGGPAALMGPTGGYLLAFPFAAALVGLAARKAGHSSLRLTLACLAGLPVIYAVGFAWYAIWMTAIGEPARLMVVLSQSVLPFLVIDTVKAILAAAVAAPLRSIVPR